MIHVDTASTFVTKWNAMGLENGKTVSIENVIINVHELHYPFMLQIVRL